MNTNENSRSSGLLTLMLFLVFAICIVSVILGATGIYERLSSRSAEIGDRRATAMFVAVKLRQNDISGGVRIENLDGADALVFTEELEAGCFCTWIYCHEGWLYEILVPAKVTPRLGDGEKLIPAQAMELKAEGALVTIAITDAQGEVTRQSIALRSGGSET